MSEVIGSGTFYSAGVWGGQLMKTNLIKMRLNAHLSEKYKQKLDFLSSPFPPFPVMVEDGYHKHQLYIDFWYSGFPHRVLLP